MHAVMERGFAANASGHEPDVHMTAQMDAWRGGDEIARSRCRARLVRHDLHRFSKGSLAKLAREGVVAR
jgi:hypothetical protein